MILLCFKGKIFGQPNVKILVLSVWGVLEKLGFIMLGKLKESITAVNLDKLRLLSKKILQNKQLT